jgi:hypothetical protein
MGISGLAKKAGSAHNACGEKREAIRDDAHLPPSPMEVSMLLKKIDRAKNGERYATMLMIILGLLANLRRTVYCFQQDSLWKNLNGVPNPAGSHDVCERQGVRLKMGKTGVSFSIGYRQKITEFAPCVARKPRCACWVRS